MLPTKLVHAVIQIGYCNNQQCNLSSYYLNYYTENINKFENKYHFYEDTINQIHNLVKVNERYIIHMDTINVWIQGNILMNGVRCWNSQLNYIATSLSNNLPHPKNSPLFTRAFILYNILKFNKYLNSDTCVNKMPDLFLLNKSTNNDPYADLKSALIPFIQWNQNNFGIKWRHSCNKCHLVNNYGDQVSYMVMDGKVIGHQICRAWSCGNTILSRKIGFCQQHIIESNFCFVINCLNMRNMSLKQPLCFVCDDRICQQKVIEFNKTKFSGIRKKGPVSVEDLRKSKLAHEKAGFRYPIRRKYLSSLFVGVWGCGMIMNVKKLFTHESHPDIINFLESTITMISEYPSVIVYDKACILLKTLRNRSNQNEIESVLANEVCWVVDKFHFKCHNADFCEENCNPYR